MAKIVILLLGKYVLSEHDNKEDFFYRSSAFEQLACEVANVDGFIPCICNVTAQQTYTFGARLRRG